MRSGVGEGAVLHHILGEGPVVVAMLPFHDFGHVSPDSGHTGHDILSD